MQEHEHDPHRIPQKVYFFGPSWSEISTYLGHTLTVSSDNVVIPKKWNVSKDCWSTRYCLKNANPVEGPCGWCGAEGMCCRYNKLNDKNSGCHSPEMKRRMEELGHDSKSKRGGHYCI